jgi:hypothetical protein
MRQKEMQIDREMQTGQRLLHNREHREGRQCNKSPQRHGKWIVFVCLAWMAVTSFIHANNPTFLENESWNYSVRFKYGLVNMKAGSAQYHVQTSEYDGKAAVKSSVSFKTNSFFDAIYMVRDTFTAYASFPDFIPLYHHRALHEGDTHFSDELWIQEFSDNYTELRIQRVQNEKVRFDTLLIASNAGYDIVNIFLYIRQLNFSELNPGDKFYISTFLGRVKANLIVRYLNQTSIAGRNKQQHNAFHFSIDISDEVFTESKSAMEMWITDDEYHIPLKLKAKLKIGAAEAHLIK